MDTILKRISITSKYTFRGLKNIFLIKYDFEIYYYGIAMYNIAIFI